MFIVACPCDVPSHLASDALDASFGDRRSGIPCAKVLDHTEGRLEATVIEHCGVPYT